MIALVSYNQLPLGRRLSQENSSVRCYESMFNPKSPKSVHVDDTVFQDMYSLKEHLDTIIVFCGKKSSGSCEIIKLFCKLFSNEQHKLFFVLCYHDLCEKKQLLQKMKVPPIQWMHFSDHEYVQSNPCNEDRILIGMAHYFLQHFYEE